MENTNILKLPFYWHKKNDWNEKVEIKKCVSITENMHFGLLFDQLFKSKSFNKTILNYVQWASTISFAVQILKIHFVKFDCFADTMGAGEWGSEEGYEPRTSGIGLRPDIANVKKITIY